MLMALLYTADNEIAAAAPACDQSPLGDQYWLEIHEAELAEAFSKGAFFETAYITIADPDLRARLLQVGVDDEIDGQELAVEVVTKAAPDYRLGRAA